MSRKRVGTFIVLIIATWSACSVDIVPVSSSRLKAARKLSRVNQEGSGAPGYFLSSWSFAPSSSPSERTLGGGYLMDPAQVEISGGSVHLRKHEGAKASFVKQPQIVQTTSGRPYVALERFDETLGSGHRGIVRYQLSNDGQHWYFFNGSKWASASPHIESANSATDVNAHIKAFALDAGPGSLFFRAFLSAPSGDESVELQKIDVAGIAPETDSWD